jgi:putative aminopeptidase FrvX
VPATATRIPPVLRDLLTLPTAPFLEDAVLDYIEAFCRKLREVEVLRDRYGNLRARYRRGVRDKRLPLVFAAHTDHPGFASLEMRDGRTLIAAFRGWVEPEYFTRARVRFWADGRWVRGQILRVTRVAKLARVPGRSARPEEVAVRVERPIPRDCPGMWDLPEPRLRSGRVHARACDDIAGCAAMLALLERLSRKSASAEVYALFTRAEEVGFIGAIGAARLETIPRQLPIIAIETSKELPSARIGDGPILRVGDKSSVFTPAVTTYCGRVAADLAARGTAFDYQRKLMDGGTCESTAYCAHGFAATGVCVALGNYHNMDTGRRRIAPEYISLRDWTRMVEWFEALVLDERGFRPGEETLRRGLDERFESYRALLERSAGAG